MHRSLPRLTAALAVAALTLTTTSADAAPAEEMTTWKIEITTCYVNQGGTDGDVKARLFKTFNGVTSEWTYFDKPGYDDFEKGDKATYDISFPKSWGTPGAVQFGKDGRDDWCLRDAKLVDPAVPGVDGWHPVQGLFATDNYVWITTGKPYKETTSGITHSFYQNETKRYHIM
ncbi:PLAT/LH2 domain-containing protein [Streptomyces sp. NPDC059096]|uniref:PLAT/LH2 domain-containing protein n=1 Tax=Streptomyces sp. NPDC059096 TaxID=3346727 RepID=UPI00369F7A48